MKKRNIRKIISRFAVILLVSLVLFVLVTFIFHTVRSSKELELLNKKGYYNPVSVGDYCLNVAKFGNKNGKHTIIGMAGLGTGDFSVAMRQTTACLEEDNLVVFVDRAGYGFSDDTDNDMTLEYIVDDYRKALKNAGIEAPYVLMPHSIGGAYANYWASNYPDEIEGVVFVDGSQLSENAFDDYETDYSDTGYKFLIMLAKMGFSRFALRKYFYLYPDNFSDEEQKIGDVLMLRTLDSIAPISEEFLIVQNAQKAYNDIISNDIPKIYICASWGIDSKENIEEYNAWTNRQIVKNNLSVPLRPTSYDDDKTAKIIEEYRDARNSIIYPYAEKMGNCEVVLLSGDHMIYEHKPEECGEIIKNFIDKLDG